jgi:hypothetical protein
MNWLYFTNPETGGTFEAPDEEGVRERYEALGWVQGEKPDEGPLVPSRLNQPGTEQEWVTLYHPAVNATHEFPANTESIAGAMKSGWTYPPGPPAPPAEEAPTPPAPEPESKSKAKASAKAVDTEEVK